MGVAAASLGALLILWNVEWPGPRGFQLLVHISAGLCLMWGLFAVCVDRMTVDAPDDSPLHELTAVLNIAKLATGLVAGIIMLFAAIFEGLFRTVSFHYEMPEWHVAVGAEGLIDLAMLAVATFLGWRRSEDEQLITVLFWITLLSVLWATYIAFPAVDRVRVESGVLKPVAVAWQSGCILGGSLTMAVFTIVGGRRRAAWRESAWPDALHRLTESPPHWPGYRYSVGIVGVSIMLLGCATILSWSTAVGAMIAGVTILTLVGRRWEENMAELGLSLVALSVISALMPHFDSPSWTPIAFGDVFNRALIGLAIMSGFWHWLAGVWSQQLDDGRAWTTTGRLIHTTERVGYILGTFAVLMSAQLAFWPIYPGVENLDNSTSRWVLGTLGYAMTFAALGFSAIRTAKPTLAWLAVLSVVMSVIFILVRTPETLLRTQWASYWPTFLAVAAAVCILAAGLVRRRPRLIPFFEPCFVLGILVAPIAAIIGVAFGHRMNMPERVSTLTFACLSSAYLLASFLPGPRKLIILAVICGAASLAGLF